MGQHTEEFIQRITPDVQHVNALWELNPRMISRQAFTDAQLTSFLFWLLYQDIITHGSIRYYYPPVLFAAANAVAQQFVDRVIRRQFIEFLGDLEDVLNWTMIKFATKVRYLRYISAYWQCISDQVAQELEKML
ncbi:hypothetical protein BXT84_14085 [Sulfobacillus thermotolerans]|uniref:Uncharacterized protein n=1 Tax=Sulfobacillus thermotolerans TaxID=338644 RepID=A0ABM6RUG5_9FIRM|nr:hypothetical protein BXT84_14085 [Sulfobacillus thermotolerans]